MRDLLEYWRARVKRNESFLRVKSCPAVQRGPRWTQLRDLNLNKIDRIRGRRRRPDGIRVRRSHLLAEGYGNVNPLGRADCDLVDTPATFAQFERLRPDHVFHAAARVYGILRKHETWTISFENIMINTDVVGSRSPTSRHAQDHPRRHRK